MMHLVIKFIFVIKEGCTKLDYVISTLDEVQYRFD